MLRIEIFCLQRRPRRDHRSKNVSRGRSGLRRGGICRLFAGGEVVLLTLVLEKEQEERW